MADPIDIDEVEQLRRWKAEAMAVLTAQFNAMHSPGALPGESLLHVAQRLHARVAELELSKP